MRRTPQALAPVVSTGVSLPGELWSKFAGVLRQSIDVRVERSSYRLADTNFFDFYKLNPLNQQVNCWYLFSATKAQVALCI